MSGTRRTIDHNVRWYNRYEAASSTLAWLPIFFLYFNQYVTLDEVIRLGACYYLAVVVSEVPSGYFSDRYGRRITLVTASLLLVAAYAVFIVASGFKLLLLGEILLAFGIAFQSGTNSALLYDSMVQLHGRARTDDGIYAAREAQAKQAGLLALAVSALLGGLLGTVDLVWPYVLSLLGSMACLAIAWSFVEPDVPDQRAKPTPGFWQQLRLCAALLKQRLLAWLFVVYLVSYALQHIPYEFFQPYIQLLSKAMQRPELLDGTALQQSGLLDGKAPLVAGIVTSLAMFGGVLGARLSTRLHARLGLVRLMLTGALVEVLIIAGLALLLHPIMLIALMFRNFPMAMTHGPMLGAIAAVVETGQRATFLSLQSLARRLAFSLTLFLLARLLEHGQEVSWPTLSRLLTLATVGGLLALLPLWIRSPRASHARS